MLRNQSYRETSFSGLVTRRQTSSCYLTKARETSLSGRVNRRQTSSCYVTKATGRHLFQAAWSEGRHIIGPCEQRADIVYDRVPRGQSSSSEHMDQRADIFLRFAWPRADILCCLGDHWTISCFFNTPKGRHTSWSNNVARVDNFVLGKLPVGRHLPLSPWTVGQTCN